MSCPLSASNQAQPIKPAKGVYRIRNWPTYNAGLVLRGSLTVWIEPAVLCEQPAGPRGRGRPYQYTDQVIQALLTLKQVYRLPLRALMGFAQSLKELVWPDWRVPHYSTLSRRAQQLAVVLPRLHGTSPLHLVVDSTGVKLYGEGEWKVRQHGVSKRRSWRKVHLALDGHSGQVCAALMTHQEVGDGEVLLDLLEQIPADTPIEVIGGDGAYDTRGCHQVIAQRRAIPAIPPREGAAAWPEATPGAAWRNQAIETIAKEGKMKWKQVSAYHRRSLAENLMYRFKTLTGEKLAARRIGSQSTEISIRVGIMNRMGVLARPYSVRIS